MGIVGVAFFGNLDEAGKAIAAFGRFSLLGLLLAGFISYGLLPFAQDFPSFALLLGLVMLPLGAWAATNPMAIPIGEAHVCTPDTNAQLVCRHLLEKKKQNT